MMFKSCLISVLFVATALAAPSPSAPLRVSIAAVSDKVSSGNLVVSATVENPSEADIRVVKLNTLLDETPVRTFRLFKGDTEVDFRGFRVTPDLTDDAVYTTIAAGQSITVKHSLSSRFDFASTGAGTYKITASSVFQYGTNASSIAFVDTNEVTVEITSIDSEVGIEQTTPQCSNDSGKLSQLQGALAEARALAGGAASDTRTHPNSSPITRYFGGGNRDTIWYNLDRIAGDLPSSGTRVLDCNDPHGVCAGNSGIVAYTLLVTSGGNIVGSDIFGCNPFWGAPVTTTICSGRDLGTRGSIILHELSHAVFGSKDTVYGCSGSAALSDGDKIQNADNYACFGVQIYHDYNC
ncbi:Deuterolysin metalloprotease family-domain-containing protein [Flagelloscypha sp. PMI_526]|nr:Deuterolysin metalloprotease family-domain-containing protein [Flagelloscypha sp. PMI_526]